MFMNNLSLPMTLKPITIIARHSILIYNVLLCRRIKCRYDALRLINTGIPPEVDKDGSQHENTEYHTERHSYHNDRQQT